MSYKGKYVVKNPGKYVGDVNDVVWRSLWERITMVFLDTNNDVVRWSSESIVIPYICATDGKRHSYYVDFYIEFKDGKRWLVEVKPHAQTKPPRTPTKLNEGRAKSNSKTRQRLLNEAKTYAKNISKWEAATKFAEKHGMFFALLTEKNVQSILGIRFIADGKSVRRLSKATTKPLNK